MNQEDPIKAHQLGFAMILLKTDLKNPSLQETSELFTGSSSVCDAGDAAVFDTCTEKH